MNILGYETLKNVEFNQKKSSFTVDYVHRRFLYMQKNGDRLSMNKYDKSLTTGTCYNRSKGVFPLAHVFPALQFELQIFVPKFFDDNIIVNETTHEKGASQQGPNQISHPENNIYFEFELFIFFP